MQPDEPKPDASGGVLSGWTRLPLYLRILLGLVLGVAVGLVLGPSARSFDLPARLVLRVLGALAPAIVLLAVVHALMTADVRGRIAGRLGGLLLLNTTVAIGVGLLVANVLRPGDGAKLPPPSAAPSLPKGDVLTELLNNVPDSLLRPIVDNKVIGVVLLAIAFGLAARRVRGAKRELLESGVGVAFDLVITILHWVIAVVPLAVFGKVASIVGQSGFAPFRALGVFVLAVLCALLLQATYYLVRIRAGSWARPIPLLRALRDALVMAFSTASSTATMPVTYARLRSFGLRERSASLGALVGSNFNNDGTALYEAMSALFIAQLLGYDLPLSAQLMVVLTSIVASVGAAGIPEAGLVTMTLVFTAVNLPIEYIALLLTVDWFLDRCRTTINVLGDVNVACLLDGKVRGSEAGDAGPAPTGVPS
jgi:Na+/H+-dicarboxylate symporter